MHRPRHSIAAGGLAAALVAAPVLAGATFAADPIVVVEPGDTLTSISRRHGVEVERIVELNQIPNANRIFVGQRLRLVAAQPAPAPAAPTPAPAARTHTVRAGENLTWIARRYGVTIAVIADANRITDPSRIFAGQRLTIPGTAPAAAPTPAAPQMPPSMAALVAKRDSVRRVIVEEAERFGVPVPFALAVAWQESGWQQGVVSHAGAIGVMQLLPATGEWVGEAMLRETVDLRDLRQNVRAGVRLLGHYLDRYDGNRELVLAAYYQGQTAADRHGVFGVTRPYIASITILAKLFGG